MHELARVINACVIIIIIVKNVVIKFEKVAVARAHILASPVRVYYV